MLNFNNTITSKILLLTVVVVFFKSTANHSYLVKVEGGRSKAEGRASAQWIKVNELKEGMDIEVPQGEGLAFYGQSSMPLFADTHLAASDDSKRLLKNLRVIPSEEGKNCRGSFFDSLRLDSNQDYPRIGAGRETKDITEIIVKGQEDTVFSDTKLDNFFIIHTGKAAFQNRINFITGGPQGFYSCDKEAFVGKKFHLGSLLKENVFIFDYPDGVMDCGLDIFSGKLGITIGKDALNGIARFQKLQEHINRDAGSFDAGFAETDIGVNRYSFLQIIRHLFFLQKKLYHKITNASSLIPSAYVQASADSAIFWDKVVSIEPVGYERIWDIEAEGTHNFIGNRIFAHNTAIGPHVHNESLRLCQTLITL